MFGVEVAHAVSIQVIHLELLLLAAHGCHTEPKLHHSQEVHDQQGKVDGCHGEESLTFPWSTQEESYGENQIDESQRKLRRSQLRGILKWRRGTTYQHQQCNGYGLSLAVNAGHYKCIEVLGLQGHEDESTDGADKAAEPEPAAAAVANECLFERHAGGVLSTFSRSVGTLSLTERFRSSVRSTMVVEFSRQIPSKGW